MGGAVPAWPSSSLISTTTMPAGEACACVFIFQEDRTCIVMSGGGGEHASTWTLPAILTLFSICAYL